MNFYVTTEPCRRLKNMFSNLSSYYIIDVDNILESSKLDILKPTHQYLINVELKRLISTGAKSKRYSGIIYINKNVNFVSIESIRETLDDVENSTIDNMVVLDDYDVPKMKPIYKMFDEVVFFHSFKKPKIIECVPNNFSNKKQNDNE